MVNRVVPDESVPSIELQYRVPPLPTSAADFGKLVEIAMHEPAGKEPHCTVVATSCNCKAQCTGRRCCLKNQVQYSVHGHSDEHDCGNPPTPD